MATKTATKFFKTNRIDAIAHCVSVARKLTTPDQFGFGGNSAADKLVSDTVTAVYSAVWGVINAPALWLGTHAASIEGRDDAAIAAGRLALDQSLTNSTFPERDNLWLFEYLFGLPAELSQTSPTPDQIRAARGELSQTAAAALIGKPLRTWQNWEAPIGSPAHRDMDPALFDLFLSRK